ncbi:MAG: hypothetical protein INH37_06980 [Myxococcaceae bacterium]|jgi:hypothetical protein|nr:hypothetical protein [Myxococcaceae bacterium]
MSPSRARAAVEPTRQRTGVTRPPTAGPTHALLLLALTAGCRCGSDVSMLEQRFRLASPATLDFGRALEGTLVTRRVTLLAETRLGVSVSASATRPFGVEPLVDVPGGSEVDVEVSFLAGFGASMGELVLRSGPQEARVALSGVGVRKPACVPSGPCRLSEYSLELDRCVEAVAPDEARCEPDSQCLEQGRCRAGQCLGVARRCDDDDACTSDGCSSDAGCIHVRRTCPAPTAPCRVPTCDARTGCSEATAPDGTPCGRADCVSARVCASGQCVEVETPEGTECGPAVACFGVSRCRDKRCARPDAGAWEATWTARLDGAAPREARALVSFGATNSFTQCDLPLGGDAPGDGGAVDAGRDGGASDAGACALRSYTSTGFERFAEPIAPDERLLSVGVGGMLLLADGGVVFRTRALGRFVAGWETGALTRAQVASRSDGGVVLALSSDGGTRVVLASTAATEPLVTLAAPASHVAVDENDRVVVLGEGVVRRFSTEGDGGLVVEQASIGDAGFEGLALTQDTLVAGASLVRLWPDGGATVVTLAAPPSVTWRADDVLVTPSTVFLFFEACEVLTMSCLPSDTATWVRAYSRVTGAALWEDVLLPDGLEGALVGAAAVRLPGGLDSALAAVVQETRDGGAVRGGLVVTLDGGRLECPFPDGTGRVASSTFLPGQLVTLATQGDGGVVLQAWPLGALPLETSGWPQAGGLSSQRRATP